MLWRCAMKHVSPSLWHVVVPFSKIREPPSVKRGLTNRQRKNHKMYTQCWDANVKSYQIYKGWGLLHDTLIDTCIVTNCICCTNEQSKVYICHLSTFVKVAKYQPASQEEERLKKALRSTLYFTTHLGLYVF